MPDYLLDLTLEADPSDFALNRKWAKGHGKQAVRLSPVYRGNKKDLRQEFRDARQGYTDAAVGVRLTFSGNCDIDAPLKAVLDCLQKSIIVDDAQILVLEVEKCSHETKYMQVQVWKL